MGQLRLDGGDHSYLGAGSPGTELAPLGASRAAWEEVSSVILLGDSMVPKSAPALTVR